MTTHWKAVEQNFTVVLFFFLFYPVVILENLSLLDLALSRVKGLKVLNIKALKQNNASAETKF